MGFTRRSALKTATAALGALAAPAIASRNPDVVVVAAGIFGAWTARALQRNGLRQPCSLRKII